MFGRTPTVEGKRRRLHKRWVEVVIAFGCNVGDCPNRIGSAIKLLSQKVLVKKVSPIVISEPYGVKNQPPFHNGVLIGFTRLTPYGLLRFLKQVEKELGRRERCRWCEREIDLDIIYYDSLRVDFEDLKIPHPDRLNRTFVLQPLAEIEPTFVDFSAKKTAKELLLSLLNHQK